MVTELDHSAIETRIVDILQANSSLYTTTAEADKFRVITKGHPPSHSWKDKIFPYLFVSFKNSRTTLFGSKAGDDIEAARRIVSYDIVFAVNEKTGRAAETALNDFQKIIIETLEENVQLKNPVGGTDPKCVESIVTANGPIPETIGFDVQARSLSLICQFRIGTGVDDIVNSGNVVLTNATDGNDYKFLFNVTPIIDAQVSKFQLDNSKWDKFVDLRDFAIEADMYLDASELATWISYTVQTNNLPVPKSFTIDFPDKNASTTTTLTGTFYVTSLRPSATDSRDANIHIRLESVDGLVAVS